VPVIALDYAGAMNRLAKRIPMDDIWRVNRKGTDLRDTRLTLRVPQSLKAAIEREARRDRRTVADVVIMTLEARFAPRATRKEGR
jgi:polysaccharide pyruvyl transferase WcaK-like protein